MKKFQVKLFQTLLWTSVVPLAVVGLITIIFLHRMAIGAANQRLTNNLKIAQSAYRSVNDNLKFIVRDQNRRIYALIGEDQIDLLKNEYAKIVRDNRLDFFIITDNYGKVLVSMTNPAFEGRDYSRDYYVRRALRNQTNLATEVLDAGELQQLGLLEKAAIAGVPEPRGLVIKASMPLINNNEIIVGTMTAGYLLNNNNAVVIEKITRGTDLVSSIFLGDVRVCSDVPFKSKEKAVGSKLDTQAAAVLLEQKRDYFGRMAVSGNWYLASYTTLYNVKDEAVGILGIGLPEKSIFAQRDELTKIFIIAVVLSVCLSLLIGLINGGAIAASVNKLYWGIEAFARGDFTHRIEISSNDEIEELANFFNKTMQQLLAANRQLEVCSRNVETLESQVSYSAQQLEAAQKQLLEFERMAAMGRMATAVSHELRNTFAEIQTSLYNLKSKMNRECPQFVPNLKGVEESLTSANETIANVLRFSYPKKLIFSDVDVNYLIESLLAFPNLQEMFKHSKISVDKELDQQLPHIKADGLQLREAMHNLIVNAVQAMPQGGKLGIFTYVDQSEVRIKVVDTGTGMSKEALENLFTPFFTTKSRGLGLGLSITRATVSEHGGSIQVFSELNQGTTFIISLPVKRPQTSAGGG
ncbi:MAG: ATP-binding protein [Candidatus Omnitrophica bacterium]|nr:ATP-binding protein [Candidatus Omnitrophota bacterium]